jgi:uncharacterized OB-fold protein
MTPAQPTPKVRSWPAINEDTEYFWAGLADGELRIQECVSCRTLSHPPKPHCPVCGSFELGHRLASGLGEVYSHVTFHHPLSAGFSEPYNVSVIALDEGVRLVSQVIGAPPEEVAIGQRVKVAFTEVEPGLILPLFRRLAEPA